MKKLLLLLAGLLFAVLPSKAQNGYTVDLNNPIKETKDFVPGEYVIYCQATGKTSGFLFYKNGDDGRPFRFNNAINITSGYISNAYYVWTVAEVEENGKKLYTFTNKQDNSKYLLKDNKWNQNMAISADKEIAKLEAVQFTDDYGIKTIALKLPERITPPEGTANADPYIFCNADGDPNLSYWGSDNPKGAVHFTFYPVSASSSPAPKYPFMLSDAPKDGQFAENTHWYYWTLRGKYASYVEGQNYISLSGTNPKSYGSFWAFVEKADGVIEVYNAATGANKVLASTAPIPRQSGNNQVGGDETNPIFVDKSELSQDLVGAWKIKTGNGCFYLKREGQTEEYYLNERTGKLAFWTSASSAGDAGSQFKTFFINAEEEIANAMASQDAAIQGVVGSLNPNAKEKYFSYLEQGTITGIAEALKISAQPNSFISFDANKYYRLMNVERRFGDNYDHANDGGYLEIVDYLERTDYDKNYGVYANTRDSKRAAAMWKFETTGENTYKLFNLNSSSYFKKREDNNYLIATPNAEETDNLILENANKTQFLIKKQGTNNRIHISGVGNYTGAAMYYTDGAANSASAWYLLPAETIELNISRAGYATVNYPFAVQLPKELTAYTGTANAEKSKFMLEEIQNGEIPANTPVVIEGTEGLYSLTIDYTNQEEPIIKDLSGSLVSMSITTDDYILAKNSEEVVGFYKTTQGGTLAQNKAYIKSTPAIQAVRGFGFSTEGDGTTGIENTVTETENEEYYDLQGRRVMNPTKGIYVTKSGKKVLFVK